VALTTLMVGHQLRTRTGWEVPFGFAFLTLLVSGYAPVLALTPLYGAAGLVSLAIAAFVIRMLGSAGVSDLAVVRAEGSPALQLERAGVAAFSRRGGGEARLMPLDTLVPGSSPDRITLDLRQGALCPELVARLDAVWMRYTVLGVRHEQRIPLVDGPSVGCR
jgi:hypothetical protein